MWTWPKTYKQSSTRLGASFTAAGTGRTKNGRRSCSPSPSSSSVEGGGACCALRVLGSLLTAHDPIIRAGDIDQSRATRRSETRIRSLALSLSLSLSLSLLFLFFLFFRQRQERKREGGERERERERGREGGRKGKREHEKRTGLMNHTTWRLPE